MKGAGSKRLPWRGRLAAALLALACASCIAVPVGVFTRSPYSPEVLQKLSAKGADRDLVRRVLGNPALTKAGGEYWFYWNSRATWGIIGGSSSAVITDDEWLAVRFDKAGKVVFVEKNDLRKCLSDGMCFGGMAPSADDAFAKSYRPKADECAVYLFLDRLPWPFQAGTVRYFVDGAPIGHVGTDTYLFLAHPAGKLDIAAYDLKISARCIGGEKLYVKAVKKIDTSWLTGEDLAPLSAAEGETAIGRRRAALHD
ncbi:MAG: hypothetical protein ACYCZR_05335 [Burkholderiales bacterium]